jgi:hypothetical protein
VSWCLGGGEEKSSHEGTKNTKVTTDFTDCTDFVLATIRIFLLLSALYDRVLFGIFIGRAEKT